MSHALIKGPVAGRLECEETTHVISIFHLKGCIHTAVSGLTRSTPTITRLCHIYSPGNCHSITRPARCASEREVRRLADIAVSFGRGVQPTSHQSSNTPRWAPVGMGNVTKRVSQSNNAR